MKTLATLALFAVLYFELSNGLHLQSFKYRVRREAKTNEEIDSELQKLHENALNEIVALGKSTVTSFTNTFEKVIEQAGKDDVKGEDIENIQKTTSEGKELLEKGVQDDNSIEKLFEIFGRSIDIATKFDELEDPTDEQKKIKKILDDHNLEFIAMKFFTDFSKLRSNLDEHVSTYIEGLTEAAKEEQAVLVDWFTKFKSASGTDCLIDTTMSFFGLFDNEDD